MTLTEIIARLEELEGKATKGPWEAWNTHHDPISVCTPDGTPILDEPEVCLDSQGCPCGRQSEQDKHNIALVAALRTHARTLIAAGKVAVEAKGLSFGEDWNNGTHANLHGYRQRLLAALAELDAAMKEPT